METGISSRATLGNLALALRETSSNWVDRLSLLIQSDQASEDLGWLTAIPAMREWIGGRDAKGLKENGITVKLKHFEITLKFPTVWFRRRQADRIKSKINGMASRARSHWDSMLSSLLNNGAATVCYDGKYFFDTTHQEGNSGVQSNLLTVTLAGIPTNQHGTPTAPSAEEMVACALKGVQQILSMKDDSGEPLNDGLREFILFVPITLWAVAQTAFNTKTFGGGATNVATNLSDGFSITPIANPRLTWTDRFALIAIDPDSPAFIKIEEGPATMKAIAEGSELEFDEDMWKFGVDAWRNVAFGFWQKACMVVMA